MAEENKNQIETLLAFLVELESEGEGELSSIIAETQSLEQRLREIEVGLTEKVDENLYFFSPIGVLEDKEDNRELLLQKQQIQISLDSLQKKLASYKQKKQNFEAIRQILAEKQKEEAAKEEAAREEAAKEEAVKEEAAKEEATKEGAIKENAVNADASSITDNNIQLLESQENDRNRIAAELHDSVVQTMTGLVHKTEFCLLLMDTDSVRVKLELQKMIELTKSIINEIRDVIFNLRPLNLQNNLSSSIEAFCLQTQKTRSITSEISITGKEPELLPIWKLTLYRVFQEAVSNVVLHSNATKMKVSLSFEEKTAHLCISDNGVGFASDNGNTNYDSDKHFGISFMKERVHLLQGTINITSEAGKGTSVDVRVPYTFGKEKKNESD